LFCDALGALRDYVHLLFSAFCSAINKQGSVSLGMVAFVGPLVCGERLSLRKGYVHLRFVGFCGAINKGLVRWGEVLLFQCMGLMHGGGGFGGGGCGFVVAMFILDLLLLAVRQTRGGFVRDVKCWAGPLVCGRRFVGFAGATFVEHLFGSVVQKALMVLLGMGWFCGGQSVCCGRLWGLREAMSICDLLSFTVQ